MSERYTPAVEGDLTYEQIRADTQDNTLDKPYNDRTFTPDNALYRPRSNTAYNAAKPITWKRPHQLKGADPTGNKMALVKDGIEPGDVEQGELGDCYLLGAMASIAASGATGSEYGPLFKRLLRDPERTAENLRRGFCTFMLYKFGRWAEVTVDTLLPCNADDKPIFAHCRDPNELWVPLLEKAYAKLHGSYEALDGGSVTAALVDLSGGVGENLDLAGDDEYHELMDGTLWRRLKRYAKRSSASSGEGHYLLGAALSMSEVVDQGKGDVHQTDQGVLVNHAYTLLDVSEVGGVDKTRLLKLRNPWGSGEWKGAWSDESGEWKTTLGKDVQRQLSYTIEGNDGTFMISWEDFQQQFNRIYVCRVYDEVDGSAAAREPATAAPGAWFRYEVEGEWGPKTSGGCFNFPSWRINPQWEIKTADETNAVFILMQEDPRMDKGRVITKGEGDEGGPKYDHKIGMYVMKGSDKFRRKVLYDSEEIDGDDVVDSTPYMEYREVCCNTMDEEDEGRLAADDSFVLCPSTFHPGKQGAYRIVVLTERPLAEPPTLIPPLTVLKRPSHFVAETAGGCRNFTSWRNNDQFLLRLSKPARVSVVMMREDLETRNSTKPLLGKKSKAKAAKKKPRSRDNFLVGFVVSRTRSAYADRRLLEIAEEDEMDKTSYSAAFEVGREFVSDEDAATRLGPESTYAPNDFVIVPSTYEPGKTGSYELAVYTDDADATLTLLPVASWQRQHARGEWRGRSAGGSRNHPSWVRNPLYSLSSKRECTLHVFLRQAARAGATPDYPGVGFYVGVDDHDLDLRDVICESGFRKSEEVHAQLTLAPGKEYLLVPMTYKKGVEMTFEVELFSDQPLNFSMLADEEAEPRRKAQVDDEAARTIVFSWVRARIRRELRKGPEGREAARELMDTWFRKPSRNTDEGYLDINLALNALETAFIQLTGKADAKGTFFPRMRERLRDRGHKIADYDVCL